MKWLFLFIMSSMLGLGCANCQKIQQQFDTCQTTLTDQDFIIKKQESTLRQNDQKIAELKETIATMESDIAELNRKLKISSSEKGRYDDRLKSITFSVRKFIKKQIQDNRTFLTDIAMDDFIGNELIKREHSGESGIFIVDVSHPVPGSGQINGIGGYFSGSADMIVKLLRPVGKNYVVTYEKNLAVKTDRTGKHYIDFDNPLFVEKNDVIAYYFPKTVNVPYDSGIGTTAYSKMKSDKFKQGGPVEADDIWHKGETLRKYSLSYYGIFNTKPKAVHLNLNKIENLGKWDTMAK